MIPKHTLKKNSILHNCMLPQRFGQTARIAVSTHNSPTPLPPNRWPPQNTESIKTYPPQICRVRFCVHGEKQDKFLFILKNDSFRRRSVIACYLPASGGDGLHNCAQRRAERPRDGANPPRRATLRRM